MAFQVKSLMVQAKTAEGGYVHVSEGGLLPDNMDADTLERFLADGMVEEVDDPAEPEAEDQPAPRKRRSK